MHPKVTPMKSFHKIGAGYREALCNARVIPTSTWRGRCYHHKIDFYQQPSLLSAGEQFADIKQTDSLNLLFI